MSSCKQRKKRKAQAGFSMVEMLMAAFILSIGILGIAMLQVMSLRAARGGQNLTTAVQVAERVMDQVELEGRLSWLNITDSQHLVGAPGTALTALRYINQAAAIPAETYNASGQLTTDPTVTDTIPIFTMNMAQAPVQAGVTGTITDVQVTVTFVDTVDASNTPINRSVVLSRRILHG